jgi:hypothetical protein
MSKLTFSISPSHGVLPLSIHFEGILTQDNNVPIPQKKIALECFYNAHWRFMGINTQTDSQGKYFADTILKTENGWAPGMTEQLRAFSWDGYGVSEIKIVTIDPAPNFNHLEVLTDDLIVRAIELFTALTYFDTATNTWIQVPNNQPLVPNTKYRCSMQAGNEECESRENVYVTNVQFIVENTGNGINFFTDETYHTQISFPFNAPSRFSSPVYPNVLSPHQYYSSAAAHSSSHLSPIYRVFFMVTQQISYDSRLFRLGVYADAVPKGHYWRDIRPNLTPAISL